MRTPPEVRSSLERGRRLVSTDLRASIFLRIVAMAVGVRVVLEIIGLASLHAGPLSRLAVEMWSRWDAPHLLRVAEVGYRTAGEDAFFVVYLPFFPLAVRLASVLFGNIILSGLVVSFVCSVGAGWFLYRIVRLDAPHEEAWRAVVLLFAFPTAYFLSAPYSDAMFLFVLLACVYAARAGQWGWSGVAGAVATGTRLPSIAVMPALAAEALRQPGGWSRRVRRLMWTGFVAAGLALYLLINWRIYGSPLHFVDVQRSHWHTYAVPPWASVREAVVAVKAGHLSTDMWFVHGGRLAAAGFAALLLAVGWRRLRPIDRVYGWAGLVILLSYNWLISLPRYLLGLYPLFVVMAWLSRRRAVFWSIVMLECGAQAWFFWRYARWGWTF